MLRKFCLSLFLFLFSFSVFAQSYLVSGKVVDALTKDIIEYASVGVLRPDSSNVTSVVSDKEGKFCLKLKDQGSYILKVSFVGFQTFFKTFKLSAKKNKLELEEIVLEPVEKILGEAIVKTTLSKVEQKEDTTVFNAGAYKVPEGSSLEALIKQLPGVEVADDGTITWNGKKINELLVNGKDFFKGENKIAMENLPSNLVSKVKAYDKKSDYTEQTGIEDGEEKAVLDISTKKKLDQTWISNINLAYGTKDRYSTDAFVSRYTDRSRFSAYASLGNIDGYHYGNGGGLTSHKSGGFDLGWENDKEKKEAGKFEIGGSGYYGYSGTDMVSSSSSETFLSTGSSSSFSNSMNRNKSSSAYIGMNMRMQWNPDSMTSIRFRPSFSFNKGDNEGESRSATFNDDPYAVEGMVNPLDSLFGEGTNSSLAKIAVNTNEHQSLGDNRSSAVNGELNVLRRLNSKGRNFSFRLNAGFRSSESNAYSISKIFYYTGKDGNFLNQYSHTPSKNWNYNLRLGYAEPFTEKLVAELRYSYGYKFSDSDRSRYNLDRLEGGWGDAERYPSIGHLPTDADSLAVVRDLQNSQYATYKYYDHNVDLSLQYKTEEMRFNVGVELNPEKTKMEYNRPGQHIDTLVTRDVFQVIPDARFRYRFSKTNSMELRYRGRASQPSMTNLLAVVDNSNPLSVSMGNPGLKPSWTNNLSLNYSGYNNERQRGIYVGADYSQTGRSFSNLLVYDETTGIRYMRPENISGNWNANAYLSFNSGLGKEKYFTLMTYSSLSYQNDVGYVSAFASASSSGPVSIASRDDQFGLSYYDAIFDRADVQKNTTRSLHAYEKLRLGYHKDWLDFGINGTVNYSHSASSLQDRSDMNTWHFDYGGNLNFDFDFGLSISSDIRMRSRRGYSDATMNTDELLWNATLSQSFLKDRAATVSLQFYDILHEQSNVHRSVNAMQRSDSWTNAINSYCMLHFVYKLNIFSGSRASSGHKGTKGNKKIKKTQSN